jgi:hypothetical protein
MISQSSGWELSQALSINNNGQIVAIAANTSDGFTYTVLLSPKT